MTMQEKLNQYYKDVGIAPVSWSSNPDKMFKAFKCKNKCACRAACLGAWNKKEAFVFEPRIDGVTVSQEYQDGKYHDDRIPRIVVLSLSKPRPWGPPDNEPAANSKTPLGHDTHWSRTLVTVRSLLHPFIAPEKFPKPVEYVEDGKEIEKLFVHVRTAKCCSNANGGRMEHSKVYANCGGYLRKELSILKPDVIVTQGNYAHREVEQHAFEENARDISVEEVTGIETKNRIARIMKLKEDERSVYWLRMIFPAKGFGIMKRWDKQAGPAIESESNVVGAKREHFVRYGKAIKDCINDR